MKTHLSMTDKEALVPELQLLVVSLSACLSLSRGSMVVYALITSSLSGSRGSRARLIWRGSDSMLRCIPVRRGWSKGEVFPRLPSTPRDDTCLGPNPLPVPRLEKPVEEFTLSSGAGLVVR